MTLHVFNPEHDLALAANLSNYTSPHAGRQLRTDLGFLPAIWAADGYVLVEDVEDAKRAYSRLLHKPFDRFVDKHMLSHLDIDRVEPWGWDLALRSFLLRYGVNAVPSEEEIGLIRDLSHRKHAVWLLKELDLEDTTGCSMMANHVDGVRQAVEQMGRVVVKAPWSSSGRGIRFIDGEVDAYQERWIQNVIARQGSVAIEKYCHKVKDFGMEFESDGKGTVRYFGLSLFHTQNGAYTGNILATEQSKAEMISRYISRERLLVVKEKICSLLGSLYKDKYKGPFGVDLMIVRGDENVNFLLNPCVEINLRRTMGHVALALSPTDDDIRRVMRIMYNDNAYKLKIQQAPV